MPRPPHWIGKEPEPPRQFEATGAWRLETPVIPAEYFEDVAPSRRPRSIGLIDPRGRLRSCFGRYETWRAEFVCRYENDRLAGAFS